MSQPTALRIRPSTEADLPALQAIYADAVTRGTGTFETEVPSVEELARRRQINRVLDAESVGQAAQGQGVGRVLLAELIAKCEAAGARQMLAVIGDANNTGSIGLHSALGFAHTGVLKSAGWKFGRWLDVVLMQRTLGLGDSVDAG